MTAYLLVCSVVYVVITRDAALSLCATDTHDRRGELRLFALGLAMLSWTCWLLFAPHYL